MNREALLKEYKSRINHEIELFSENAGKSLGVQDTLKATEAVNRLKREVQLIDQLTEEKTFHSPQELAEYLKASLGKNVRMKTKDGKKIQFMVNAAQVAVPNALDNFSKKFDHQQESEPAILNQWGLYLSPPHGELIWSGKKNIIIKSIRLSNHIEEPLYLLSGRYCYGVIKLGKPKQIGLKEFKELSTKHQITEEERKRFWPGKETLYLYPINIIRRWQPPREWKVQKGAQIFVRDVKFEEISNSARFIFQEDSAGNEGDTREEGIVKEIAQYGDWYKVKANSNKTYRYVVQHHIRGNSVHSVTGDTPIIIRDKDGLIDIIPIEQLFPINATKDIFFRNDLEVLSKNGFTKILGQSRTKSLNKNIKRINTRTAVVDVSESHSLLQNGIPVQIKELKKSDCVDHITNFGQPNNSYNLSSELSWVLGFFAAEGSALIYPSNRGDRKYDYLWKIVNTKKRHLLKCKKILEKNGILTRIVKYNSDSVYTLCVKENLREITRIWNGMFYSRRNEKMVPRLILNSNNENKQAFLKGLIDGDGHRKNSQTEFTSKSMLLAQGAIYLGLQIWNSIPHIYLDRQKYFHIRFIKSSRSKDTEIIKILPFKGTIYTDNTRRERRRKKEIDLRYSSMRYLYDLETEDHNFAAGVGFILTHNTDLRLEVNDHLIGWTLDTPGSTVDPKHDKFLHPVTASQGVDYQNLAERKLIQPKVWLTVKGKVPAGGIGATAHKEAEFQIVSSGTVKFGVQKHDFHEYFLYPDKKWNQEATVKGRWIVANIPRPTHYTKAGEGKNMWSFWKPNDQRPYVEYQDYEEAIKKAEKEKGYVVWQDPNKGEIKKEVDFRENKKTSWIYK